MSHVSNIAAILQQHAQSRAQGVAIIDGPQGKERHTSFAELEQQVAQFARLLQQHGCKSGDTALLLVPMSKELYVVLLALFRVGMVAMFVDPSSGREHLLRCCERIPPRLLIGSSKAQWLRLLYKSLRSIPLKISLGFCGLPATINARNAKNLPPLQDNVDCSVDHPALITFTSGSTGVPKAAVRSHGFLLAQHRALAQSLEYQAGEIDVTTLPVFVLANLASAVTSLIPAVDLRAPALIDADVVLDQIQRFSPQRSAASPAFYERLIDACARNKRVLPTFKRIDTGGAPVFPNVLQQMQAMAPRAQVYAVYGSTEAEPIAHCAWSHMTNLDRDAMLNGKGLLVGAPVKCIELKIMRDQWSTPLQELSTRTFNEMQMPVEGVGEIVVSGEHVLPGYLDGVGNEQTKFNVDGKRWHRTGDAGYLDAQGRLWLLGRCAARIEDQHGVMYPFAVETVARSLPQVYRAACLAYQQKRYLLVQAMPGQTIDIDALTNKLQWAKLQDIRQVESIPMDKRHNAKVDYTVLQQRMGNLI